VPRSDFTHNELEIWYPGQDELSIDVISPDGSSFGTLALGENGRMTSAGKTVMFGVHRAADPNNGDNVFMLFLESASSLPTGTWTIRLHGVSVADGSFHGWIERDDNGQSSFVPPHDNTHTLGSISCGHATIAVGSYDAHKPVLPLSFFSSAGPTRDGREKPEISAPGHDVLAAHSRTRTGVTRKSGTSMAAPAVTGLVALVLAQAAAKGRSLTAPEVRALVVGSARRTPPSGDRWHERFGRGRVDASTAVDGVG
jgi:subtilisin family serine protease